MTGGAPQIPLDDRAHEDRSAAVMYLKAFRAGDIPYLESDKASPIRFALMLRDAGLLRVEADPCAEGAYRILSSEGFQT